MPRLRQIPPERIGLSKSFVVYSQSGIEPGACIGPLALRSSLGQAKGAGCILQSEPGKETQTHQPRGFGVLRRKLDEGIIQSDELLIVGIQGDFHLIQIVAAVRLV
jgi:hypothetical protein